jgi:hypothetical protein
MALVNVIKLFYDSLLSEKVKEKSEHVILYIAIGSFIIHLALIYCVQFGLITVNPASTLFKNPIAAIYTPFSFILLYEVYLLIYYLQKSFTIYVVKQYEIITLIVIRRLFKDLSNLSLTSDWFSSNYDLQFSYDIITSLVLFFLIYLFYFQTKKLDQFTQKEPISPATNQFITIKKGIALLLVPIFLLLTTYSFSDWVYSLFVVHGNSAASFVDINTIFFEQFFTILIFADVLLLLFSFFISDQFHQVMRNSGFIISTILIRISFSTTGLLSNLLIVSAVVYGLTIVFIHTKFEKHKL